jgi:pimeloyl-ACP methyl ester carboxylesterase
MYQLKNNRTSRLKKKGVLFLLIFIFLMTIQLCYSQTDYIAGSPKLAIWELGNSDETIVILHGGPAAEHSYLRPEWDTLSTTSRIIYYDQRGCGKSDTAECYTWIDHIHDLKRLKDTISKNNKIILAGSSWGAEFALLYALYYPDDLKGLILSGFCGWTGRNPKKIDINTYDCEPLPTVYLSSRTDYLFKDSIVQVKLQSSKEFLDTVEEHDNQVQNLHSRLNINDETRRLTLLSRYSAPDLKYLQNIKVPILAFGTETKCAYQDWSDVIEQLNENTQRIIIENSCHDPWFTQKTEFFQECFKYIENIKNHSNDDLIKNTKR